MLAPLSSILCLHSFSCRFCYSKLVLFHFAAYLCLISSCVSYCVCHFLWFGISFLHAIPTANTSCYSLFLFIVLFHISFHAYLFIQKDLGLCGPNNVDWIKRVLGPMSLSIEAILLENCITWQNYILLQICILLQIAFSCIYFFGPLLLFGLLGGPLGLTFSSGFPLYGLLGMDLQKMGINTFLTM